MKNALLACVLLCLARPGWAQTLEPDVQLLQSVGWKTDGPALLDYFRQQGSSGAAARLFEPSIQAAAARRLGAIQPPGTAEVLLAFCPQASDANVIDELCSALAAVARNDGIAESMLVKCLNDPAPFKRTATAQVLLRGKSKEHLSAIRKMLHDDDPLIRLRVGVALLEFAQDKDALPVLVDLLDVLDPDQLYLVKAVLTRLADDHVEVYLGDSAARRKLCRDDWWRWLSENMHRVDLTRLGTGIRAATVAAYLKLGAEYGEWPRSADRHKYRETPDVCDLPGFRFKFDRFPLAKLPYVAVPFGLDLSRSDVTDEKLKELAHLKNLTTLGMASTQVTDAGLKELEPLPSLTTLHIEFTKVTNAGVKELAPLTNLTTLHLPLSVTGLKDLAAHKNTLTALYLGCHVSDKELKDLAPLTKLTTLGLAFSGVTPEGLKDLAPLQNLTTLHLSGHRVTDDSLRVLYEIGLLHALCGLEGSGWSGGTKGKNNTRPKSAAEVVVLDLGGSHVTDAGLKHLAPLKNLADLDLSGISDVTDKGMKELAPFQNLTRLRLSRSVTDVGLKDLATLQNLTALDLSRTAVTGAGLKHLASLKNLATLDLGSTSVTGAGLKDLASLQHLATLDLGSTSMTGAGLKDLASLQHLTHLDLHNSSVTDAGLEHLTSLKKLTYLNLNFTKVTDAGLAKLTPLKNLTRIGVSRGQVSDASLRVLREMNLLHSLFEQTNHWIPPPNSADEVTSLSLDETKVTDAGLKELAPLKNLTYLSVPVVTDATLRELRAIGLLHALSGTYGKHHQYPKTADDVAHLNLKGTRVTDAGLKELAGFKNLGWVYLAGTAVTDAGLKELASFENLAYLDLSLTSVTDAGLEELASLRNLTDLYLHDTKVTAAGLKHLAGCKNLNSLHLDLTDANLRGLREAGLLHVLHEASDKDHQRPKSADAVVSLYLRETKLTDAGLKELAGLKNLASLDLSKTEVTAAGLNQLAGCKNLTCLDVETTDATLRVLREIGLLHALAGAKATHDERPGSADDVVSLDLRHSKVTDAGLKELAGLTSLQSLDLGGTRVTGTGLKELTGLKSLQTLDLGDASVMDIGLKGLAGLTTLQHLDLRDAQITDMGLKELAGLRSLQTLDLTGTSVQRDVTSPQTLDLRFLVTDAGVAELRKALPGLNIVR